MTTIDLGGLDWQVRGWRPFSWRVSATPELGLSVACDIPAVPARVPGSVQDALYRVGWLKDWNTGLQSLEAEWVEHRHWEFFAVLVPQAEVPAILQAEGLDYSGWILIDQKIVATFQGALIRHDFDLSEALSDGKFHTLRIIFDTPPEEQGQYGFSSASHHFKPRYNFGWDWCPRFVPIGIWDRLTLEYGRRPAEVLRLRTEVDPATRVGQVSFEVSVRDECEVTVEIGREVTRSFALVPGRQTIRIELADVRLWWPNGLGEQILYEVKVSVKGVLCVERRMGFKNVRWLPCDGAPADAEPWICEINGRPLFLQGVNWTPIAVDYHSVPETEYRRRIDLYREMGCNVLRVWGGAFLEREIFYDLCDENGLLVWQEFPLSSSAIDNWPPEDEGAIDEIRRIARDYTRRRGHHASLLLWCGGNELQGGEKSRIGIGRPVSLDHPCLTALGKIVREETPDIRYLPTSASGPRFLADEKDFGKGLHHDVHGPWNVTEGLERWAEYWSKDDALMRSETGTPGASPLHVIQRFAGNQSPWPPDIHNPYWLHTAAWWMPGCHLRRELKDLSSEQALERYVEMSQGLQAEALAIAATACRARFPRCGGFLVWMGHDAFPCPANTAIIDFEGNPKPGYFALRNVFCADQKEIGDS